MTADDFDAAEFGDSPRRVAQAVAGPDQSEWWDLRKAAARTGIPIGTLRRWHRRGAVTSRLLETSAGSRIELLASDVTAKAAERRDQEADLATDHPASTHDERSSARPRRSTGPARAAEDQDAQDAILVPLDSWQKMLTQLGNLHEAGQQLAAARERAARAETEAAFLRERLAEVRAALESPPPDPDPQRAEAPLPAPDPWAGEAPRSTPGRALDHLVNSAKRAWHQRRARGR